MDIESGEVLVEEIEIEGEAHAEGVDARTARNEQARTRLRTVKQGKAEQAGTKAGGNGKLLAQHHRYRKALQPRSKKPTHEPTSPNDDELSPPSKTDFAFLSYMAAKNAKSAETRGFGISLWG